MKKILTSAVDPGQRTKANVAEMVFAENKKVLETTIVNMSKPEVKGRNVCFR